MSEKQKAAPGGHPAAASEKHNSSAREEYPGGHSHVHTLAVRGGTLTVTVTEVPHCVYMAISGPKTKPDDLQEQLRVQLFLWPIVDAYRDDPRRMEISGQHANYTGHVRPIGSGGWTAYAEPLPARGGRS